MTGLVAVSIEVESNIDKSQAERRINGALNRGMDRVLDAVELVQVHKYLSNALPAKPPGSRYKRTFRLRRASRKRRTGYNLPDVSGVWSVDESRADYAPEVVGPQAQQAQIHRGRWLSLEEITQRAEELAPVILQEEINAVQIL